VSNEQFVPGGAGDTSFDRKLFDAPLKNSERTEYNRQITELFVQFTPYTSQNWVLGIGHSNQECWVFKNRGVERSSVTPILELNARPINLVVAPHPHVFDKLSTIIEFRFSVPTTTALAPSGKKSVPQT
jgi:hypothetical protein